MSKILRLSGFDSVSRINPRLGLWTPSGIYSVGADALSYPDPWEFSGYCMTYTFWKGDESSRFPGTRNDYRDTELTAEALWALHDPDHGVVSSPETADYGGFAFYIKYDTSDENWGLYLYLHISKLSEDSILYLTLWDFYYDNWSIISDYGLMSSTGCNKDNGCGISMTLSDSERRAHTDQNDAAHWLLVTDLVGVTFDLDHIDFDITNGQ